MYSTKYLLGKSNIINLSEAKTKAKLDDNSNRERLCSVKKCTC